MIWRRCFFWTEENQNTQGKKPRSKTRTKNKLEPLWYRAGIEPTLVGVTPQNSPNVLICEVYFATGLCIVNIHLNSYGVFYPVLDVQAQRFEWWNGRTNGSLETRKKEFGRFVLLLLYFSLLTITLRKIAQFYRKSQFCQESQNQILIITTQYLGSDMVTH